MNKDQAMQFLQGMDDAAVRRRIQQIAQRQWAEWGISIANTKISLLAEVEYHKVGYGDILVIKDRAERLQAEVEALRGELEAKDKALEWYGDRSNYREVPGDFGAIPDTPILDDDGARARNTLKHYTPEGQRLAKIREHMEQERKEDTNA